MTVRASLLLGSLVLATLSACAKQPLHPVADAGPGDAVARPGPGRLVIVGGGLSAENAEVYQAILAGREGRGPLCVVPTASADPAASMESSRAALARYAGSASVTGILLSRDDPSRANAPSVAEAIRGCSGFYFTGGVQTRVLDVFLPQGDTTAAFRALWVRWQEGAVVAGSSAGAAMMSGVMISSGSSEDAVRSGVAAQEDGEGVNIRAGMGFFTRGILDQHFLARGRIGRLVVAVLATDSLPVGLGIDENTALVVEGDSARVVGASGVVVVDGRGVQRAGPLRASGLKVTLAGTGDLVRLGSLEVHRGVGKEPLRTGGAAFTAPADPFARWAFLHLLVDLSSGPAQEAAFDLGGAELRVREGQGFSAAAGAPGGGVEGTPSGFSAGPFVVDLLPGR
jgi:cyanophycinase